MLDRSGDGSPGDCGPVDAIAEMLRSAPLLEDLTVQLLMMYNHMHSMTLRKPCLSLDSLRGSNPLECLTRVKLGNFRTEEMNVVHFFLGIGMPIHKFPDWR